MKKLSDYKENIHTCSKCGLCQGACPLYKVTGNDCTVSRGIFIMLSGVINGDLKMSKTLNRYLDLCLKCGACSKFCPSGIDAVKIINAAKSEYFKLHGIEKFISFIQKHFIFKFLPELVSMFKFRTKSKKFDKKVIYFDGCGGKIKGNRNVIKLMNLCGIEVITPKFNCCGIPFLVRGDFENFEKYIKDFISVLKKYDITEIVTACASCEKTLKDYEKYSDDEFLKKITVKNIYNYIKESNINLKLKKPISVTFHKPCNHLVPDDLEWILENTENLRYLKMKDYDSCCGFNGLLKFKEYNTFLPIMKSKCENVIKSGANTVLTSCIGCETILSLFSGGKYKTADFVDFLCKNLEV